MRVPLIDIGPRRAAVVDGVAWASLSFAVGYAMHRRPLEAFATDGILTRPRAFEAGGRWYERRLRIGRWKDSVPEAGAFFAGGFSKASLGSRDQANLERFAAETRRAELTHWALLGTVPLFAVWNPPAVLAGQVGYALAANLPFIAIQRYNRARLERVLERRRRRAAVSSAAPSGSRRPAPCG